MRVQGRWLRAVTVVLAVAALGCTNGDGVADPPDDGGTAAPAESLDTTSDAAIDADARIRLERELGHHTMLTVEAMRATADDSPRRRDARRALERVADQLSSTVDETLDISAGGFNSIWVARTDALLALATGEDAEADLATAQEDYGMLIAKGLGDQLSAADAAAQLAEHDEQLIQQLARYRDEDRTAAFSLHREAFSTAFQIGQQLVVAAGAAPETTSGPGELRSAFNQLLAEHTWFALLTARRAARGARDARHPAAALNGNTEDLTAALRSIYDEPEAVTFDELWREAIAALMRFTAAAAELDDETRQSAAGDLRAATRQLAEHLAATTEGAIDEQAGREALTEHFRLLRRHSNAAANNRFRQAYDAADEAYATSGEVADLIARGIAEHRAEEFGQ